MNAVVDTSVLAYYLPGTPRFAEEAGVFLARADELLAPALWEAELANVVWMSVRSGVAAAGDALPKLTLAEREGLDLVTFDQKLLAAFPGIAKRPRAC